MHSMPKKLLNGFNGVPGHPQVAIGALRITGCDGAFGFGQAEIHTRLGFHDIGAQAQTLAGHLLLQRTQTRSCRGRAQ